MTNLQPTPLPLSHVIGTAAVCLGVLIGPLLLGSTFPLPRLVLEALMALAAVMWAVSSQGSFVFKFLPLAIAAVGILQLIPLPDSVLVRLAPVSAGAWKIAAPAEWGMISLDPAATTAGLRRLMLALGLIGATAAFSRHLRLRMWIIQAFAASCVLTLLLAFVFRPSKEDRLILGFVDLAGPLTFWKSPVHAPLQTAGFSESDLVRVAGYSYFSDSWVAGDRIGPYIVSNHFAGAICLLFPVTLSALMWLLRGRISWTARAALSLACLAVALLATASIASSRAGTASLALALVTLASFWAVRPWLKNLAMATTLMAACLWLLVVAAMHGPLRGIERFLPQFIHPIANAFLNDGRVVASHLAKKTFIASPFLGTGFGTYYDLSAYLDRQNPPWYFAHNDYLQLLAETGSIGGLIAALGVASLIAAGSRFYGNAQIPDRVRDAGCWASIAGIAAHSAFDWNLHVPANAFLACTVAGLAYMTGSTKAPSVLHAIPKPSAFSLLRTAILLAAYIACLFFLARDARSDLLQRSMRDSLAAARVATTAGNRLAAVTALTTGLGTGRLALRWDPTNAHVALLMGQMQLHLIEAVQNRPITASDAGISSAESWFSIAKARAPLIRGIPARDSVSP